MLESMAINNDTRGWIMTYLSGLACVLGSSVICIDYVVRLFPGKKGFRIQDSNAFLSCSLSLSAGVMLFSALHNLLSSSNKSFLVGGFSPKHAAWMLIGCFLVGVVGIQLLSSIFHHFMPTQVVGCDHTHDDNQATASRDHESHQHGHDNHRDHQHDVKRQLVEDHKRSATMHVDETVPLLQKLSPILNSHSDTSATISIPEDQRISPENENIWKRPSLQTRISSSVQQLVTGSKELCEAQGPCFGYSDRCAPECFSKVISRGGRRIFVPIQHKGTKQGQRLEEVDEESEIDLPNGKSNNIKQSTYNISPSDTGSPGCSSSASTSDERNPSIPASPHHHHVPENAFLSIGLQTAIAIALHKLPEGFITYATNHANPNLGLSVFLALFIHNISEGFALCLPLFLATNSRLKALVVSTVLGGLSQPLGAAVAAAWLAIAARSRGDDNMSEGVYGAMFAITAGIMASVALSLLQESFELTHNKRLCIAFAFVGMGILGCSSALTA